jgi:hypothetical protein
MPNAPKAPNPPPYVRKPYPHELKPLRDNYGKQDGAIALIFVAIMILYSILY